MTTPQPPLPLYLPGMAAGESDESTAASLRAGSDVEASRSAALLMARHWQPAADYAVICLAGPGPLAHMVTATVFHQALDRLTLGEPAEALRPRLLVAVRDTVLDWAATDRVTAALPGLGKPAGGRGMLAANSLTPENRTLAERAFHTLPRLEQTLLWHTAVEAEPVTVPATLLGVDPVGAAAALEQSREKLRAGVLRAHRELAPSGECRHYNRLLDVPVRRGGAVLPDVRQHLDACSYCRYAAEQLGQIESGAGLLLAEAVLGWGARRYLDSRPGRGQAAAAQGDAPRSGGRRRGGKRGAPARGARRGRGTGWSFRTGAGVLSAGLLVSGLAVAAWPEDDGGRTPVASAGAAPAADPRTAQPSATASATPPLAGRPIRLRNAGAGLCLGIKGEPERGALVTLALCSDAVTQQWTYDADGLLHSQADPQLCLDSHADAAVVILGTCDDAGTERGKDVRYDLTVRGELLPLWDETLALASADARPGADIVVSLRDRSPAQAWLTDTPSTAPGSLSIAETPEVTARQAQAPEQGA
ncbi:ricin-type beta-trefoil lectin domain protein [Streptomyces sp. NPDC048201]|uniref:ricin-type beta-trefoil lectin domain protein n=1 Tax=Streptomyces sp. NPDC048201 TaxID=3365513 RepID=UPI00371E54DF